MSYEVFLLAWGDPCSLFGAQSQSFPAWVLESVVLASTGISCRTYIRVFPSGLWFRSLILVGFPSEVPGSALSQVWAPVGFGSGGYFRILGWTCSSGDQDFSLDLGMVSRKVFFQYSYFFPRKALRSEMVPKSLSRRCSNLWRGG